MVTCREERGVSSAISCKPGNNKNDDIQIGTVSSFKPVPYYGGGSFIIAAVLVLVFPVKMTGASQWSYYYDVKNFDHGDFIVDSQLHTSHFNNARQQSGMLMQYVEIGDNQ